MPVKAGAERGDHRHDDERHNGGREDDVGDEDEKIKRTDHRMLVGEADRANVVVVDDVTRQEEGRDGEGGHHADDVLPLALMLDEPPPREEEKGADGIERGVDRRKVGNAHPTEL